MARLASYATKAGRDPRHIEVVYFPSITQGYELREDGERSPFRGTAEEIAADIRSYEDIGVSRLVLDFFRTSSTMEEGLEKMEILATRVWPLV